MTTYSVIIGSPPGGSILPSGAFGNRGWLTKASTPAERLNIAFRFGKSGRMSKSGRIKARYSISVTLPASGQMRISRSGSWAAKLSRQACAVPICLSRLTMSSAMSSPLAIAPAARAGEGGVDQLARQVAVVEQLVGRSHHHNREQPVLLADPERSAER